jgi:pimeloyl-ACP methyl ester carboxylesterase
MTRITARDGTGLYLRDWGQGRPVVLIHGWPLSGDSWEYLSVRLAGAGFRVIAYDRRGFGRSDQPFSGYDYDTLADDLAAILTGLSLEDVVLVGFSMGGGEVARYMSRHAGKGVSRAVLISSVVPMLQDGGRGAGVDPDDLQAIRDGLRADRPAFLETFLRIFYGNGVFGGGVSDALLDWSLQMALQASPKATLDCVTAFGTTDFRPDLASFHVPTLVLHGTADRTVPIEATAHEAVRLMPAAKLIEYEGGAHGIIATHADQLFSDLLAFLTA